MIVHFFPHIYWFLIQKNCIYQLINSWNIYWALTVFYCSHYFSLLRELKFSPQFLIWIMNHSESFPSILFFFFGPAYRDSYLVGIAWVLGECLILKVLILMGNPGGKPWKSQPTCSIVFLRVLPWDGIRVQFFFLITVSKEQFISRENLASFTNIWIWAMVFVALLLNTLTWCN